MAFMEESTTPKGRLVKKKSMSTLNSTDALALVEHGGEITLSITTPVGTKFVCSTSFIGTHTGTYILTELPAIPTDDLEYYFQEGFWCNARAVSPRGEGALIYFRSQLLHVIHEPIPLAMFSIPSNMQVTQLRKEPRFEVNLAGKAILGTHKMDCEIRDISRSGCRFFTPPLGKTYQVGDIVTLQVYVNNQPLAAGALEGKVCNLQRATHYARYGFEFTENGRAAANKLLGMLKFTGTKLTLHVQNEG
jgi:hypothetical protein